MQGPAVTSIDEKDLPGRSSWLRRLAGFDELGILLALVLFFIAGSLSSPYFLNANNLAGILAERNVPRLSDGRSWAGADGRRDRHFGRLDIRPGFGCDRA